MTDRERIIFALIHKGGLMGRLAEMYIDDEQLSDYFILECFEYCKVESIRSFWGKELMFMICIYKNEHDFKSI